MHGLHLSDNLSFKQICDKEAIVIEYDDDSRYSDVEVSNNSLIKRSNDDPDGYWPWKGPNVKMPDFSRSDAVEDTELISTFLERSKITDVTWISNWNNMFSIEDVMVRPAWCDVDHGTSKGYQCVPPHMYVPRYIWTAPQPRQGLIM